jgi:hypothetical protein
MRGLPEKYKISLNSSLYSSRNLTQFTNPTYILAIRSYFVINSELRKVEGDNEE